MQQAHISFIGGGNMAASLIGGLIADGVPADAITVSDPSVEQAKFLGDSFGINIAINNQAAVDTADVLVLAVKPQVLQDVCSELAESIQARQPLVVSIAAGLRGDTIDEWLGGGCALVRCMPNTPALVQTGATGLYANQRVSETQKELAESILRAVGLTIWVDSEAAMDAVTATSGSGPAYYFLFMEAMEAAAQELGLSADTARLLTLQTALGAARMALEASDSPAVLREKVTSPGGTTEQAIGTFEAGELRELVKKAMQAASDRSAELADILSKKA